MTYPGNLATRGRIWAALLFAMQMVFAAVLALPVAADFPVAGDKLFDSEP